MTSNKNITTDQDIKNADTIYNKEVKDLSSSEIVSLRNLLLALKTVINDILSFQDIEKNRALFKSIAASISPSMSDKEVIDIFYNGLMSTYVISLMMIAPYMQGIDLDANKLKKLFPPPAISDGSVCRRM